MSIDRHCYLLVSSFSSVNLTNIPEIWVVVIVQDHWNNRIKSIKMAGIVVKVHWMQLLEVCSYLMISFYLKSLLKEMAIRTKISKYFSMWLSNFFCTGKVGCKSVIGKHRFVVGKKARRLQAQQLRENKRNALLSESDASRNSYLQQPPIFIVSFSV